jgi:type I restriction enzyme S subunit
MWPADGFDTRFAYYMALAAQVPSRGYNDHFTLFKQQTFPKPSLGEQVAIARALHAIELAMAATDQVVDAARTLKRSLGDYLLVHGLPAKGQASERVVERPALPARWKLALLGDIADVRVSSASPGQLTEADFDPAGERVLFLKVADLVNPPIFGHLASGDAEFRLSPLAMQRLNLVPAGAIVFPKRGGAIAKNRKRITAFPTMIDPNLAAVVPQSVDGEYLFRWLETLELGSLVEAAVLPQINKKDLAPLPVPVPPRDEQLEIGHYIRGAEAKLAVEEQRRDALEAVFISLLHDLMSGRVRVPASIP